MKIIVGLLVAACACQAVFALPAGSPQDDVEIVRPTGEAASTDDFNDFKGVISTGTDDGYPFFQRSPQSFAFNLGFFDAFEDILRRLQARIYPQSVDSSSSDESSSSVLGRFDFDEGKANKTSTVRVENNLKVVVNDTFYDGDTGLFRVRTVNIRPLDSGEEVVEGTFHHDGSFVPATEGPKQAGVATKDREDADSDEDDSKREPLAKDETENEIRRNADQPESSTTPREPAAQSFLANTDDDGASDLNAAFVTDNTQGNNSNNNNDDNDEQEPIVSESSRTETNKPANDENSNSAAVESVEVHNNQAKKMEENYQDDAVDAVVGGIDEEPNHYGSEALSNLESGRLTIENNEETEQQQHNEDDNENDEHDKLNESSSAATKATTDDAAETEVIGEVVNAETNDGQDEQDDAEDAEDTQSNSSEFAAYEKAAEAVLAAEAEEEFEAEAAHAAFEMAKEREDLASSSSDDEDGNFEMNPTFNAEWSEFAAAATADNDKSATNDISNDIDVYDAVPIDLSNDIAVNNWAAAQGNAYPYNPDAEIISDAADRIPTAYNAIPRFERLTINTHHMK